MKYFYLILNCCITSTISAQYGNDSIRWNLSSNDSVSSAYGLKGLEQNVSTNIPVSTYINGYQKITKPTAGWPSITDSSIGFIDFPFDTEPDICYDTTGGGHFCQGYAYFMPESIKLTAYVLNKSDSVILGLYFYDTSCYARDNANNYKYLGDVIIKSDNDTEPTNIYYNFRQHNQSGSVYACGAQGGKYSAIRLYPRTGQDFFIKNMIIAGEKSVLLPIHFKYVKASAKNNSILISWAIENIQDLQIFIIEKSEEGRFFTNAATLNQTGNTSTTGIFNWIDKVPFEENNFYQIKAFEKTGKMIVSEVVKVNNTTKSAGINVYPNPVTDKSINFSMKNILFGQYQLILTNEVGQKVFSTSINYAGEGRQAIALPKRIVNGVYYISIENDNYVWNKKIIVQ